MKVQSIRNSAFLTLGVLFGIMFSVQAMAQSSVDAVSATTIPDAQQIQPAALAQMLKASGADKPVVLQVGSRVMFAQSHIPGSIFAGPGSRAEGLKLLESKVAGTAKGKLIVIYCGCCPWGKCPNMGPAYKKLRDLGFTNVKALYIPNNFGDDWAAKGFPVEHGQ